MRHDQSFDSLSTQMLDAVGEAFIENAPYAVQLFDLKGHSIYVNKAFHKTWPAPPPPEWSIFEDQQMAKFGARPHFERLRQGETIHLPEVWFKPSQSVSGAPDVERCMSLVMFPLFHPDGQIQNYALIGQDITDSKRAEKAIRESEEKFRTLFENMSQGIFYQQTDGVLVDVNQAALDVLGLTRDQFLGRTSYDPAWKVIRPDGSDLPPDEYPSMQALQTGKEIKNMRLGVFRPTTNDFVWLEASAIPQFRPNESRPYQSFVTLHDITEQKKSEQAWRESEERYRDLVESSFDMICTHDLEGNLLMVNSAAEKLSGYSRNQFIGSNLRDFISPKYRPGFDDYIDEVKSRGEASGIMRVIIQSGEERIWEYHNSLRAEGSKEPIVRGTARDITERIQAEKTLKRWNEELEEKIEKRTRDLNTLVESMVGREVRMAGLKKVIKKLRKQLMDAGMEPVADDPLNEI